MNNKVQQKMNEGQDGPVNLNDPPIHDEDEDDDDDSDATPPGYEWVDCYGPEHWDGPPPLSYLEPIDYGGVPPTWQKM
jgi:hypothetical protein